MLTFTFKFMNSMFRENKKEILFVLLGMFLCVFVVLNFADSALGTDYSSEKLAYENNRVIFSFSDVKNLERVMNEMAAEEGIENVLVRGTCMIDMQKYIFQAGVRLPRIEEELVFNGGIPERLEKGEALIGYANVQESSLFPVVGDVCSFGDYSFKSMAMLGSYDFNAIVNLEDFILLYNDYGSETLEVSYIYKDGFTEKQKEHIKEVVEKQKEIENISEPEKLNGINWSVYVETFRDLILGMIIAVLNDMFLYAFILNSRISAYSVLKLQGVSNRRLLSMLFIELIVLYFIAYALAGIVYVLLGIAMGNAFYNTTQIYGYTFCSILGLNLIVFSGFVRKIIKPQPFEIYQTR